MMSRRTTARSTLGGRRYQEGPSPSQSPRQAKRTILTVSRWIACSAAESTVEDRAPTPSRPVFDSGIRNCAEDANNVSTQPIIGANFEEENGELGTAACSSLRQGFEELFVGLGSALGGLGYCGFLGFLGGYGGLGEVCWVSMGVVRRFVGSGRYMGSEEVGREERVRACERAGEE